MEKKTPKTKKLKLSMETVRHLTDSDLKLAVGGGPSFLGSCPCHMTDDC